MNTAALTFSHALAVTLVVAGTERAQSGSPVSGFIMATAGMFALAGSMIFQARAR